MRRTTHLPAILLAAALLLWHAPAGPVVGSISLNDAQSVETCLPIGVAISEVADEEPKASFVNLFDPLEPPPVIEIAQPALVGACIELQATWQDGSEGRAEVELALESVDSQGRDVVLASDAFVADRMGPSTYRGELSATVAPPRRGRYDFTAVVTVVSHPARGPNATHALRVPFGIEILDTVDSGAITGTVYDDRKQPIAQALVMVEPVALGPISWRRSSPPVLPILPPGQASVDTAALEQPNNQAWWLYSDSRGRYWFELAPGAYRVDADANGYLRQWFRGKATGAEADTLVLEPGGVVSSVDFSLRQGTPLPPTVAPGKPTPTPTAGPEPAVSVVSGQVTDQDGVPVAGALISVYGGTADRVGTGVAGEWCTLTTQTDALGSYAVTSPCLPRLSPEFMIAASSEGHQVAWHPEAANPYDATTLVADSTPITNVDFTLHANPVGQIKGTLSRTGPARSVQNALVMAVRLDEDGSVLQRGPVAFPERAPDGDMIYTLYVVPGRYLVGATDHWFADRSQQGPSLWWPGAAEMNAAHVVEVSEGQVVAGVDLIFTGD